MRSSVHAIMWLDNTAATNFAPERIGHAKPTGDQVPLSSRMRREGAFTPPSRTIARPIRWSWTIDNVDESGKASPT
jgi:hypothetical protein